MGAIVGTPFVVTGAIVGPAVVGGFDGASVVLLLSGVVLFMSTGCMVVVGAIVVSTFVLLSVVIVLLSVLLSVVIGPNMQNVI